MKRWITGFIILITAAAVSLTGCAKKKKTEWSIQSTASPEVQKILEKALKKADKYSQIQADWDMDIALNLPIVLMVADDMVVSYDIYGHGILSTDTAGCSSRNLGGLTLYSDGNEETVDAEIYSEKAEDQKVVSYVHAGDEWLMSESTCEPARFFEGIPYKAGEIAEGFSLSEKAVTVDGKSCRVLRGTFDEQQVGMLFPQALAVMINGGNAFADVTSDQMYEVSLYIRERDYLPWRLEVVSSAETAAGSGESEESGSGAAGEDLTEESSEDSYAVGYTLSGLRLTLNYSYPDSVRIHVPGEAKSAGGIYTGMTDLLDLTGSSQAFSLAVPGSLFGQVSSPEVIRDFTEDPSPEREEYLLEDDEITVCLERAYTAGTDALFADFVIDNRSGSDLDVYFQGVAVNRTMQSNDSESGFEISAPADTKTEFCLKLSGWEVDEDFSLQELTVDLTGSDKADYSVAFDTGVKTVPFGEEPAALDIRSGGSVVFENDYIQIIAYPAEEQSKALAIPLCLVNKSDQSVSVSSEWIMGGEDYLDGALYGLMLPGTICYSYLTVDRSSLDEHHLTGAEELKAAVSGIALTSTSYDPIFSGGEVIFPEAPAETTEESEEN